jgi:hypothetical protein
MYLRVIGAKNAFLEEHPAPADPIMVICVSPSRKLPAKFESGKQRKKHYQYPPCTKQVRPVKIVFTICPPSHSHAVIPAVKKLLRRPLAALSGASKANSGRTSGSRFGLFVSLGEHLPSELLITMVRLAYSILL